MEAELLKNLTHLADFCRRPDVTLEELSCFSECRVKSYTRPLGITSPQSTLEKGKGGRIADRVIGSFVVRNCDPGIEHFRMASSVVKVFKDRSSEPEG